MDGAAWLGFRQPTQCAQVGVERNFDKVIQSSSFSLVPLVEFPNQGIFAHQINLTITSVLRCVCERESEKRGEHYSLAFARSLKSLHSPRSLSGLRRQQLDN